ncbi:MAG: RHS repeat protein, partial [Verrucomicrobiae bacterium]|nr:RHS repeat protein [Verrucomicrobiae bacterium]
MPFWRTMQYRLKSVQRPDGSSLSYGYNEVVELYGGPSMNQSIPGGISENAPSDFVRMLLERFPKNKYHTDLASITNEYGDTYSFEYRLNTNVRFWNNEWKYFEQQVGLPRWVAKVTFPGGASSFKRGGLLKVDQAPGWIGGWGEELSPEVFASANTTVTDAAGRSWSYRFEDFEKIDTENLPGAFVDSESEHVLVLYKKMTLETPMGTEVYHFDPSAGMAVKDVIDINGNTTIYTYGDTLNVGGQGNWFYRTPAGVVRYNDPTSETRTVGNETITTNYSYNDLRLMTQISESTGRTTTYVIDGAGNRTSETISDPTGTRITEFGYGGGGFMTSKRVKSFNDPEGFGDLYTTFSPDAAGRVATETVDMGGGPNLVTAHTYDHAGNKTSTTDPNGFTTTFEYDERHRLKKVTYPTTADPEPLEPGGAVALQTVTKHFTYGMTEKEETRENGVLVFRSIKEYGPMRRVLTSGIDVNFDGALTRPGDRQPGGDVVTSFGYNVFGTLTSEVDPRGYRTVIDVDGLQRPTSKTVASGTNSAATTTFAYDPAKNAGGSIFNPSGYRPTTINAPDGTVTVTTYNIHEKPEVVSVTYAPGKTANTHTTYDGLGRPTAVTDPNGKVTLTEYYLDYPT